MAEEGFALKYGSDAYGGKLRMAKMSVRHRLTIKFPRPQSQLLKFV
ncbi:MAG: hypothetical protein V7K43_08470 [Nostoc sp.]